MLQDSKAEIEKKIEKRYPGALKFKKVIKDPIQIEDFYYYADDQGKAIFLIPITQLIWENAIKNDIDPQVTRAMQLVWGMIKDLKLNQNDGKFEMIHDLSVFKSNFNIEDITILQGFKIGISKNSELDFVFSELPSYIQEAINYETKNK